MGAEETKEVYDEWNGKIHPYLLPMHLMTTLGDVNDDLKDMEETVTEAGMESILYTDRTSAISDVAEGTGILNGYIMSLIPTAKSRLDDPLYKGFDQGATEMLSRIRMEDYATDNTLSIKDHSVMHGGYGEVYEYDIKKDKLTIDDFLGLNSLKGTGEPGSLTNVPKEFQSFTDMFTLDYNEIKEQLKDGDGRQIDLETYLKYISTLGEYDHKMDKPFENFISGILDVTIVKPVIEACTGYDLITGEDLSDLERGLKAVFAVVDVVTLCVGIKGSDLAKLGVKGALKFTGKTMLVDMAAFTASYGVGKLGEELGLPLPLTLILSGAAGITVSIKLGKYVFKDSTGKVILESNVDEVLDTVEGAGGANKTPFRDLMSPKEAARYNEYWNGVADDLAKTNVQNYRNAILNGDITKPTGGKINSKVITAGVDINTGDVYYGTSGMKNNPTRTTTHPQMQEIIDKVGGSQTNYPLENCGEFNAVNSAISNGVNPADLRIYSVDRISGQYKAPCVNCENLYGDILHFIE